MVIIMKKIYLLFILSLCLITSGCTVSYNIPESPPLDDSNTGNNNNNENNDNEQNNNEEEYKNEYFQITIDENALFYPSNLSIDNEKVIKYNYIHDSLSTEYKIYSAYYSQYYDTLYIAYDFADNPVQTLKAKDLYEIEKHAVLYFKSDKNRSEDKNYLKAVRIYPDRLASSCRKGLDNTSANRINGCADYGGLEAIIDLNKITNLEDFYKSQKEYISETSYVEYEPMRDTFAHEYVHVSTFYHMAYKNNEN